MKKFTNAFLTNSLKFTKEETKLIMDAQRKFPSVLIDEGEGFIVDGETLCKEMKIKDNFNTWLLGNGRGKLVKYRCLEGENYKIAKMQIPNSDKPKNIITLTLNCAKKIAMRQNNDAGDLVCDYFILMEKAIKKGIDWGNIREPQKKSYKVMCSTLEKQYIKTHNGKKPDKFLYTNNADMLNIALFGYKSKKMKEVLEVEYEDSLRDNLKLESNKALDELQTLNTNLVISDLDYDNRKIIVENTCKVKFEELKMNISKEFAKDLLDD